MGDSVENCYNNIINKICSKYPRPARFSDPGGDFSEEELPHTAKFRPWRIKNAIAFDDCEKACAFEAYLKTHCGRAFAKRHF